RQPGDRSGGERVAARRRQRLLRILDRARAAGDRPPDAGGAALAHARHQRPDGDRGRRRRSPAPVFGGGRRHLSFRRRRVARGALEMRVTRLRRDTTLARIIHLVERAQAQRAPAQALVERFAQLYTPAVIALAVAVAILPPLLAGAGWQTWAYRALVLLVVSC